MTKELMKIEWLEPKKRRKRRKDVGIHPADTEMISPVMIDLISGDLNPFELWELHLNFQITKVLEERIEDVPGVEVLMIGTPYRMKIGIGRLFDVDWVRGKIQDVLKEYYRDFI